MNQSILVVADDHTYRAMGNITREILYATDNAATVIQHAIDLFDDNGGQVLLENGSFVLDQPLRLANNVALRGAGRGTRLVVQGDAGIIGEQVDGVTISDLRIASARDTSAAAGIILDYCGNCSIHDLFCVGFAEYGIWLRNNSFLCEIRGCSLAGNRLANILLDHLKAEGDTVTGTSIMTRAGFCVPNLVSNCTIFGGGKGIELRSTTVANLVANIVYQTNDIGFHIHGVSNSVLISGCRTFQITGAAVLVEDSHEFNLSSNVFCWHTDHGIVIKRARWGTIVGNEIIDTGSWNSGLRVVNKTPAEQLPADFEPFNGIHLLDVHGYSVAGNTIFNWQVCPPMKHGIYEDGESGRNTITDNNINFFTGECVVSLGRESVVSDNGALGTRPHLHWSVLEDQLQSFDTSLMDDVIESMRA